MASNVQTPPDYEARSKAFAEQFAGVSLEAKEHLSKNLLKAAQKLTDLIDAKNEVEIIDGQIVKLLDLRIQLDAAKTTLKLNGLDVEKVEHSVKEFIPLKISREDFGDE
jgi:hypothetical protein